MKLAYKFSGDILRFSKKNTSIIRIFLVITFILLCSFPQPSLALKKNDLSGTYFTQTLRFEKFGAGNEKLSSQRINLNFDQEDTWIATGSGFQSDSSINNINQSGSLSVFKDTFVLNEFSLNGFTSQITGVLSRDKSTILVSIATIESGDTLQMMGLGVRQQNRDLELSDFSDNFFGTEMRVRDFENMDGDSRGSVIQQNFVPEGDGTGEIGRQSIFSTNRGSFAGPADNDSFTYNTQGTFYEISVPNADTTPKSRLNLAKNRRAGIATQSGTDVEEGSIVQSLNVFTPVCNDRQANADDFSGTYIVRQIKITDLQDTNSNRSLEHISAMYNFQGSDTGTGQLETLSSKNGFSSSDTTIVVEPASDVSYSFSFDDNAPSFEQAFLSCNNDHFARLVGDQKSNGPVLKLSIGIKIRNKLDEFDGGSCVIERTLPTTKFNRYFRYSRDHFLSTVFGRKLIKLYYDLPLKTSWLGVEG